MNGVAVICSSQHSCSNESSIFFPNSLTSLAVSSSCAQTTLSRREEETLSLALLPHTSAPTSPNLSRSGTFCSSFSASFPWFGNLSMLSLNSPNPRSTASVSSCLTNGSAYEKTAVQGSTPGYRYRKTKSNKKFGGGSVRLCPPESRIIRPSRVDSDSIFDPSSANCFNDFIKSQITLVVQETRFVVDRDIFQKYPNTMLSRMFSQSMESAYTRPDERGEYNVGGDFSADVFRAVLDYYKSGEIRCPPNVGVGELREACDYFLIPFNDSTIKCHNLRDFLHEISNDGARSQFESWLSCELLPLLVSCAQQGERECHLVVLCDDDELDWDENYPPHVEDDIIIVKLTCLVKFLKYVENRDVAKQLLKERGLKKIKIGIEGYPTTKEKVRTLNTGEVEVIYDYVQRPFLCMSWEKEEARSRHVDFVCVKSRSTTNLSTLGYDPPRNGSNFLGDSYLRPSSPQPERDITWSDT